MKIKKQYTLLALVLISYNIFGQVPELDWPIEIVSEGHGFTEGPVLAPDGNIFFTDMDNDRILLYNPSTETTKVWKENSGTANGLFIRNNYLYSCEATGRSVVRYDLSRGPDSREVLASTFLGDSLGSPNDLTIIGNVLYFSEFWLGMYIDETKKTREIFLNRVYSISLSDNSVDTIKYNFELPNGVASSPDGKELYIADYLPGKLYKAKVVNDQVMPLELVCDLKDYGLANPDGLAVSRNNYIYLALYADPEKVVVISPDGKVIGYLPTGPLSSNCIFAEDEKILYITADKKLMRVVVPDHM